MEREQVLTLIIPVYNERETLRPCLERLLKTDLPLSTEIILVDDCSTDGSLDTVSDLITANPEIRVVRHERNRGKGAAVGTVIDHATGNLLAILDADIEYHPADYGQLLHAHLYDGADVVFGRRTFGAHTAFSFWYVLGNKFVNLWASLLFNTWLSDIASCLKLAKTDTWRSLGLRSQGFDVDAEVAGKFLKRRHRIHEVPISYRARGREEGKKVNWKDGLRHLWMLLKIRLFG